MPSAVIGNQIEERHVIRTHLYPLYKQEISSEKAEQSFLSSSKGRKEDQHSYLM